MSIIFILSHPPRCAPHPWLKSLKDYAGKHGFLDYPEQREEREGNPSSKGFFPVFARGYGTGQAQADFVAHGRRSKIPGGAMSRTSWNSSLPTLPLKV